MFPCKNRNHQKMFLSSQQRPCLKSTEGFSSLLFVMIFGFIGAVLMYNNFQRTSQTIQVSARQIQRDIARELNKSGLTILNQQLHHAGIYPDPYIAPGNTRTLRTAAISPLWKFTDNTLKMAKNTNFKNVVSTNVKIIGMDDQASGSSNPYHIRWLKVEAETVQKNPKTGKGFRIKTRAKLKISPPPPPVCFIYPDGQLNNINQATTMSFDLKCANIAYDFKVIELNSGEDWTTRFDIPDKEKTLSNRVNQPLVNQDLADRSVQGNLDSRLVNVNQRKVTITQDGQYRLMFTWRGVLPPPSDNDDPYYAMQDPENSLSDSAYPRVIQQKISEGCTPYNCDIYEFEIAPPPPPPEPPPPPPPPPEPPEPPADGVAEDEPPAPPPSPRDCLYKCPEAWNKYTGMAHMYSAPGRKWYGWANHAPGQLVCLDQTTLERTISPFFPKGGLLFAFDPANNCKRSDGPVGKRGKEGCFKQGSQVAVAEGKYRPIETIRPGDKVYNPVSRKLMVVTQVVKGPEKENLLRVHTSNGSTEVTQNHPFVTTKGIKTAQNLQAGDLLIDGHDSIAPVLKIEQLPIPHQAVWNLIVSPQSKDPLAHVILVDDVVSGDLWLQRDQAHRTKSRGTTLSQTTK